MLAAKQAQALEDKQTASLASNPRTHTNPPCPQTPSKTRAQKLWPDAESPPAPLTKTAFQGGVETQPRRHRQMNPLARHKASELARSAFVVSMNITAELESRGHQLAPATETACLAQRAARTHLPGQSGRSSATVGRAKRLGRMHVQGRVDVCADSVRRNGGRAREPSARAFSASTKRTTRTMKIKSFTALVGQSRASPLYDCYLAPAYNAHKSKGAT